MRKSKEERKRLEKIKTRDFEQMNTDKFRTKDPEEKKRSEFTVEEIVMELNV